MPLSELILIALLPQAASPCAECHAAIVSRAAASRHANALQPIAGSPIAAKLTAKPLRDQQGNEFVYRAEPGAVAVSVGGVSALLEWSFGSGAQGFTAVGRDGTGKWVEHRVSYYPPADRLARTPGHPAQPVDAAALLGVEQTAANAFRCFNCHATNVKRVPEGLDLAAAEPGVRCERCHGPGERHTEAARAKEPITTIRKAIFNAGKLPPRQIPEVCGECHRSPTPSVASATPELEDPLSIRFQPVGLLASFCSQRSGRLSCLTCHDPHEDARHDAAFYAAKCLGCHTAKAKGCPRTPQSDCLPCHMPRSSPAPFLTFTDHRIRRP